MTTKLKINFANKEQKISNITVDGEMFERMEVAASKVWQMEAPDTAPAGWWRELLSRQAIGQLDPIKLEAAICRIINAGERLIGVPPVIGEVLSKAITLVLANGARDFGILTVGHTDESEEEWERFSAALNSGEIRFVSNFSQIS